MNVIYKYPFGTNDTFTINMPNCAEILSVQVQHETPCIWALVDTAAELSPRNFEVFCTGQEVDEGGKRKYIGTYQLFGGGYVFHLFEI